MLNHIGYTSENFTVTDDRIYKYSYDPARAGFLKSQADHLIAIGNVIPNNVPQNIIWKETDSARGYEMEYIKDAQYVKSGKSLDTAIQLLYKCATVYSKNTIPEFSTFLDYLANVIKQNKDIYAKNDWDKLKKVYISKLRYLTADFQEFTSSSHGDFTIENIMVSGDRVVLIDGIYKEGIWSSWLLDAAKFYQNIYFTNTPLTLEFSQKLSKSCERWEIISKMVYLLMISNYIRMFPYISSRDDIMQSRYQEFKFLIQQI